MSSTEPAPVPPPYPPVPPAPLPAQSGPPGRQPLLAPTTPPPLPQGPPRPYPQLLRDARFRWWRPLASLGVVLAGLAVAFVLALAAFAVGALVDPAAREVDLTTDAGAGELLTLWWAFLVSNLLLAFGIPLAGLAVWAGHLWRPRFVSSVVGGLRWRWLLVASLASLVVVGLFTGAAFALDPAPWRPEPQAALLLLVVLLTTPLQAAGEEYFFRGWMSQAVGAFFARPVVAAVVAGAVSATLFAVAHGSQGPWLFADRFAFGVVASLLVWRTGGLEASVAAHAVNNAVIFVPTVLTGGLASALTTTDAPWQVVVVDVVMLSLLVVVLDRLARRRRLQRTQALLVPPGRHPA